MENIVTAAFDGGRLTSDGGVMLLAGVERTMGIAERFAGLIADPRNPALITHSVADIPARAWLAIACGYEDADDLSPAGHQTESNPSVNGAKALSGNN